MDLNLVAEFINQQPGPRGRSPARGALARGAVVGEGRCCDNRSNRRHHYPQFWAALGTEGFVRNLSCRRWASRNETLLGAVWPLS